MSRRPKPAAVTTLTLTARSDLLANQASFVALFRGRNVDVRD